MCVNVQQLIGRVGIWSVWCGNPSSQHLPCSSSSYGLIIHFSSWALTREASPYPWPYLSGNLVQAPSPDYGVGGSGKSHKVLLCPCVRQGAWMKLSLDCKISFLCYLLYGEGTWEETSALNISPSSPWINEGWGVEEGFGMKTGIICRLGCAIELAESFILLI